MIEGFLKKMSDKPILDKIKNEQNQRCNKSLLKVNISIFQENVEAIAKLQPKVFSQVGHFPL